MPTKNETAPKTSEVASVAPTEGNVKRSIQMKMFTTDVQKSEVALAFSKGDKEGSSVVLGQIVGEIFEVKERNFENRDGSSSISLQALGDFEAVNYATGEVYSSNAADLPKYYLEGIKAILDKGERMGIGSSIVTAIEIVLVATGKSIAVAYEVRNLVQRQPESRVNQLKAQLAQAGRLRLPPPSAATKALSAPQGELIDGDTGEVIAAPAAEVTA